jgi:hypothetical protein
MKLTVAQLVNQNSLCFVKAEGSQEPTGPCLEPSPVKNEPKDIRYSESQLP